VSSQQKSAASFLFPYPYASNKTVVKQLKTLPTRARGSNPQLGAGWPRSEAYSNTSCVATTWLRLPGLPCISAEMLCSHSLPYIENLTRTPVVFVSFSKKDRVVRGIDSAIFPVLALRLPPSDARDRVRVQRAPRRASVLYALAGNQPSTGKCVYDTRNGSGLKNGAAKRERTYTLYDMTSHNTTAAPPHFLRCYTKCRSWYGD